MGSEKADRQREDRGLPEGREVGLPDRFLHAVARAERIAQGATGVSADGDPEAFAAYQEIVLLKIALETETARILGGAARLAADLVASARALQRNTDQASG